jgi:two-component system sensor histidine kinase BaeS
MRAELEVALRGAELGPAAAEVLESCDEEVTRMGKVVDDLLTLAHRDENRLELLLEPVDLGEVATQVAATMRPLAVAGGLDLTVTAGAALPVLADRARIAQVVTNLVDNAVKYTGHGGSVAVRVWGEDGAAGLSVGDTGPGIGPDDLPRVFDRFFRLDAARSRGQGGSGLGLAICKELVEAHGGRIWAESRPGAGSTFALRLPLVGSGS